MKNLRLNQNSPWAQHSLFVKRVQGFMTYTFAAFMSIFWPIETDKALYEQLSEQFEEIKELA